MEHTYTICSFDVKYRSEVEQIFNHYIENSFAAYPDEPVGDEFIENIFLKNLELPKYIIKSGDEIVGTGFAYKYHPAKVFNRVIKFGYFILPEHTGKGLGTRLLDRLEEDCKQLKVDTILVHISSQNPGSITFHKKNGFIECGRFKKVGRKFNQDFDDVWMQKMI